MARTSAGLPCVTRRHEDARNDAGVYPGTDRLTGGLTGLVPSTSAEKAECSLDPTVTTDPQVRPRQTMSADWGGGAGGGALTVTESVDTTGPAAPAQLSWAGRRPWIATDPPTVAS